MRSAFVFGAVAILIATAARSARHDELHLPLRSQFELFRGGGQWTGVGADYPFDPARSAVIVCDMWDKHWCSGANVRVAALAQKIEPVLETARRKGIIIVHAPSETMSFYADAPQRRRMRSLPVFVPPGQLNLKAPPLPIDDSDGGCDTPADKAHRVWTRENSMLKIEPADYISDNGTEIYNLLRSRGVNTVFYVGVHANMCILNRSFAIKQMTNWGMHCILLRDLTDAMYGPQDAPHVSHAQGTELVIKYIEQYWSPTALSDDLIRALR